MSVLRRVNVLGQQRWEASDQRSVESAASNDFDGLVQSVLTGPSQGYVLRGFYLNNLPAALNQPAKQLQVVVDPGAILATTASQSGTFYITPTGTPPVLLDASVNTSTVRGAFVASTFNYVGVDYFRFADPATEAQVYLWDPTTNSEDTVLAPRALVLEYVFVITTTPWAPNVLPLAIVQTDGSGNVVGVTDSRWDFFSLSTGGLTPNANYTYTWPQGRTQNPSTINSTTPSPQNPFYGGDKSIGTLKDWMNAVMSTFVEIKGTPYWSSVSAGTPPSLAHLLEDLGNTIVTSSGSIAHGVLPSDGKTPTQAGQVNWDQTLNIKVIGSNLTYQIAANPTSADVVLADSSVFGDESVAYITLNRGVAITPALVFTNGNATVTSVGSTSWTTGLRAGDWIKKASDEDSGYYQILSPGGIVNAYTVTLTKPYGGTNSASAGDSSQFAYGQYYASATPSGDPRAIQIVARDAVPTSADTFWLFARSDNLGTTPHVYVKFLGVDLDQGEEQEVGGNPPAQLLQYVGSATASTYSPNYTSAFSVFNGGSAIVVPQITQIATGAATAMASGTWFYIYSSGDSRIYAVWVNKDASLLVPPAGIPGVNAYIQWPIATGDAAANTATKLATALNNALPQRDFTAAAVGAVVTVTNNSSGTCSTASNSGSPGTISAPFAITVTQTGTNGYNPAVLSGGFGINDGDNLTLALAKLDRAIADISGVLDNPAYDQTVDILASGASAPTSLNGPVPSLTLITLPNNSRFGGLPQYYTVGKGVLQLSLNGQRLVSQSDGGVVTDWAEVGTAGAMSNQIEILQALAPGDTLKFEIIATGGSGGSGAMGPQGNPGPQGPPGLDATSPLTISTKIGDYTLQLTDHVILVDCTADPVTISLPDAATALGHVFYVKKIDATAKALTLLAYGVQTIDGAATVSTTTQYFSWTLVTNASNWYLL